MTPRFVSPAVGIGLVFTAAQACSDATGPGRFAGTYRLDRFQGQALPAVMFQGVGGATYIVNERIMLDDKGEGIIFTTSKTVDSQNPSGESVSYARALSFTVRDARIEITYICPPNADCIAGPHIVGERVGRDLALAPPSSSKPASFYKRLD